MKKCLAVVISFVLLASLSVPGAQAGSPVPVTITLWHHSDPAQMPALELLLDRFLQDHPNVTINLQLPDTLNLYTEYQQAIIDGQEPDLIWGANDNIGALANENWIVDLDQLDIHTNWLESTYVPVAARGVQYAGKIWGLPVSVEGIALVYNKALVSSQYLPVDPLDFAALYTKAQNFWVDTGKPLICNQGFPGFDAYHIAPVFFGFGVPSYIDEEGHVYVNTPEAISAGNWLASFPPISPAFQDYGGCMLGLIEGQVGMFWTGPWALGLLDEFGVDYGILPMGKPFVGIQTFMVADAAKERGNASLALELAKFLTNTASSIIFTQANSTIPANRAALKNPLVQKISAVSGFGDALTLGVPMSPSIFSSCQWDWVGIAEYVIWNGYWDVESMLNYAQDEIEACVAAYMSP